MGCRRKPRGFFLVLVLLAAQAFAADPAPKTFTEKSALSDPVKITKRCGWSLDAIKKQIDVDYDLSNETYQVRLPTDYEPQTSAGLFVWISAGPKGDPPATWKEALDTHKLIWIGANNSGNPRAILTRMSLAFDAVAGMKAKYKIDEERVYIAGSSGGGKVASILGVAYPEVFRGGFYLIGAEFYRNVPTSEPGHAWPKGFNAPEFKLLTDAKKRNRHVLLTGEKDMNREPIKAFAAAYKADGFEHVTLFDIPNFGHQLPGAEWFEKGITALDEIPPSVSKPVKRH